MLVIKEIIEACKKREDELGEEVRGYLDERKEALVSEAREQLEHQKNQKKPNLPEDIGNFWFYFDWIFLDEDKIVPRLSDELIIKCLKGRLALNDCLNRGYVLDAYPRSFDDANKLFKVVVDDEGGAGGDDEEETRVIDDKIRPDSAIFIKNKPESSLAEISKMSLQETVGTHHTEREFQRRHKIWEGNNISANGSSVLTDFYSENNIEVLHWDASQMANANHLDCIKMYIEKDGKYNNYQSCYEDEESLR